MCPSRYPPKTFEICLYEDNSAICDELFGKGRKTLGVQEYMLANKAEAALELLRSKGQISMCRPTRVRQWLGYDSNLAVAGSGKTTRIVEEIDPQRALVLTCTDANLANLCDKIVRKFGCLPAGVVAMSYFCFLYSFCLGRSPG